MSTASARTSPPPDATAILRSSYGSGGTSNSRAMPWRSSTSASRTRRPSAASASANAAATVVLPVPPLPVTTCSRARLADAGHSSGTCPTRPTGADPTTDSTISSRSTRQRHDADRDRRDGDQDQAQPQRHQQHRDESQWDDDRQPQG